MILCVDDEKIILNSLKNQLNDLKCINELLEFAESGEEAIEVLEEYEKEEGITPKVIICDQIMPRMKGDEFLSIAHQKYPDSFKILLTGQADKESVKNALNNANLNKYLTKPWTKEELNTTIKDALREYDLRDELNKKTEEIFELNQSLEKKIKLRTKELFLKNSQLNDSINYAKRIQDGVLPNIDSFKDYFNGIYVFYKPLHVVSGDFYFLAEQDDKVVLAALDCTGHGVPGALMSMLAHSILNNVINALGITDPARILTLLHKGIVEILNQETSGIEEGMDASICVFDRDENRVSFAGARSSLIYFKKGELFYQRGGTLPVGGLTEYNREYKVHTINLKPDMQFYMFSDGFPDQHGGPDNKKLTKRRLKSILEHTHQKSFDEQRKIVEELLEEWKGSTEQTDDILLIGFEYS